MSGGLKLSNDKMNRISFRKGLTKVSYAVYFFFIREIWRNCLLDKSDIYTIVKSLRSGRR